MVERLGRLSDLELWRDTRASKIVTRVVLANQIDSPQLTNQNAIRAFVMDLTFFFFYTTCLKCLNIDPSIHVFFFIRRIGEDDFWKNYFYHVVWAQRTDIQPLSALGLAELRAARNLKPSASTAPPKPGPRQKPTVGSNRKCSFKLPNKLVRLGEAIKCPSSIS